MTSQVHDIPRVQAVVLRRWRTALAAGALGAALGVGYAVLQPRRYAAHASFVPEGGDPARSRLTGLAAQLGISVPSGDRSQSADFFAELVRSRAILSPVIDEGFVDSTASPPKAIDLLAAFRIHERDPAFAHDELLRVIEDRLVVMAGLRTGIVSIDFDAPSRALAQGLLQRMLAQVNAFSIRSRQWQAEQETQFTEMRLRESRDLLHTAEDDLVHFVASNRVASSPQLQVERDRLQRGVQMRQEIFTSLSQLYEQARIDAQRSTPTILVIEQSEARARPVTRHIISIALLGALLSTSIAVIGLVTAFGSHMNATAKTPRET